MKKRTRSTSRNRERPNCACRTAGECANTNFLSNLTNISSIRRLISGSRNSGGSIAPGETSRPNTPIYSEKLAREPQSMQQTVASYTASTGRNRSMGTGYHSAATYPVASTNVPPSAAQSKWTREPSRSIRTDNSQGEPDRKIIIGEYCQFFYNFLLAH